MPAIVCKFGSGVQGWVWSARLGLVCRFGSGVQVWVWCTGLGLVHRLGSGVQVWVTLDRMHEVIIVSMVIDKEGEGVRGGRTGKKNSVRETDTENERKRQRVKDRDRQRLI